MKRGSTMSILVTGGAGYIGSHTVIELLNAGYEVVVLDNLVNSSKESLKRVEEITGKKVTFYEGDIADRELLKKMFEADRADKRTENIQRAGRDFAAFLFYMRVLPVLRK